MSTDVKPSNWNVPNALTTLRILLVPVYGWALLYQGGQSEKWRWIALVIFTVAMITDKIDGDLARKHNLVTDFGKIADPIADKAMTGMAFVGLSIIHPLFPAWVWWTMTAIVLIREWGITLARLSFAKHVVMEAKWSGKVKTTLQAVALGGFTIPFGMWDGAWEVPGQVLWWIAGLLLLGAVILTLTSGAEFVRDFIRQRASRDQTSTPSA
ncbi:MAG TPA: CDP-diacylglycerol--glycerol-3-phosphate 3-phosphatidyltransferase [Marmoricola sp.]|nr:CDP-diacylglycerol--glycerol-3-phosphate 3-phosphatidyltransferase [Marmoricola sp.]HNN48639.1 CDP-diacylglycerol--glycerol-3-phosphate 3-phosphatidyltransferase [Marmoricola sp.]